VCGICGFVGGSDPDLLEVMRDSLRHRGPDEKGDYSDERVSLAHRRLSVVDPGAGQQPFQSEDGSIVLVFNGEIYNHPELRKQLESRGHVYRTRSDTESVLRAYLEYGEGCPEHLDGMFAFVVYDRRSRTIFGARDRFGKKPLFYSTPGSGSQRAFVFASEIRSLLLHPAVAGTTTLSQTGVLDYLLRDYVPGEQTAFSGVFRIPAGHAFTIRLDDPLPAKPRMREYWRNPVVDRTVAANEAEAIAETDRLLDASVRRRLMADVPLGVFLSGGIDSSAVVAVLARHVDAREIRTFSIGFDDPSFDESPHAAFAAKHFGTRHSSRVFTAQDCLAELAVCTHHMDEPFADPSILPTSLLSGFAREQVAVALGGDGGDELFAGYDPFKAIRPARIYSSLVPYRAHRLLTKLLPTILPASGSNMSAGFRMERFLRGARTDEAERMACWMGSFDAPGLSALLSGTNADALGQRHLAPERSLHAAIATRSDDPVRASLAYFQKFYLVDDILVKADRASMMHSLEVRSPFLDTSLAEYVNRLPSGLKYRRGETKYLLRKVLSQRDGGRQRVPDRLLRRPKKGFGIPISRWIRNELRAEFTECLLHLWPESLRFLDTRGIRRLLEQHLAGARDFGKELWALYILGQWARQWIR
jgi:asparagine synthase (glutamine-hydrolysing)